MKGLEPSTFCLACASVPFGALASLEQADHAGAHRRALSGTAGELERLQDACKTPAA